MSKEDVKRFYDTIVTDTDLRQRIVDANKKYEGRNLNEYELDQLMAEEFLPLLKEEGYYFTIDELVMYQEELTQSGTLLNSYELKHVSGGINNNQAIRNLLNMILKN